ncbi:hypothetical protein [Flavobacterium sp. 3HN19-14]|uniref:hypothetical protein n=1 Tax=Flavobacterium sp. 3HN19-14 TaxID=3448133 RepID=UPI003EE3247A
MRDIKFDGDKVVFYLATNEKNDKNTFYYAKITGYLKLTYDRNTGKEIDRKYFKWSALSRQTRH